MGNICIKDDSKIRYKKCSKCNCTFKLHISNRSQRRSCRYHNFHNGYCYDCGCFKYEVDNQRCLHIYTGNKYLPCCSL